MSLVLWPSIKTLNVSLSSLTQLLAVKFLLVLSCQVSELFSEAFWVFSEGRRVGRFGITQAVGERENRLSGGTGF